nr:TIGR01841 family phasin [uncultured Rhodopila sp.]
MASLPRSMADAGERGTVFGDMTHPASSDMEAFVAATRLNLATLTAVDRIVMECARVVARRRMEIVQQSMAEVTGAVRTMSSPQASQVKDAKQFELLKRTCERGASSTKELRDLIQHSSDEATTLLNARVDALDVELCITRDLAVCLILEGAT